ncbi:MAG: glycosyltransferase family 39 protein, partial [Halobacteriota archaeon]
SRTHGGIGGGIAALTGDAALYAVVPLLAAAIVFFVRRESLLLVWTAATTLVFEQPRFRYTVGAVAVAAAGLAIAGRRPRVGSRDLDVERRAVVAAVLLVAVSLGGGGYLAYEMTLVTDPTTPEFLDDEAMAAMEWVKTETPEDATFVVLGDAAEWFPALTDRTMLLGPWGVEWEHAALFEHQKDGYDAVSSCQSVDCVETTAKSVGASPEYVYVPKGRYTIRGETAVQVGTLERSFERSPGWEHVYENDGVVVYQRIDE